ncbi:amidase [Ignatzschineria rhizosphaerae]|uniref:Amidase n=1 Tax=Ignatzschineria rhizosphaerae TaxID=2923279 RepID=A0ABY3X7P1_9GAMM|nr:amidase [Ignatzschineria rhizosphaerae]UNM97072.1 amidase [Ignatzschineria rhizosphaerae]
MSNPILFLPVSELAKKIQSRELTSVELTKLFLDHSHELNPTLNAYISFRDEKALADAAKMDAEILAGNYRGLLHGIPMAIKDNIYVGNEVTTMASKYHENFVSEDDASVVENLKNAGVVLIGKLNMHEYAWGITNNSPHFGPVKNPWNLSKIPGGSSGGTGAAVSAGLTPVSLGTDTAGSIRIPSSACGIVGLKPTHGLVPKYGCFPLAWTLDHIGPMTKTVEDAAIVLQAIAGFDSRDPVSKKIDTIDYLAGIDSPLAGRVIGIEEDYFFKDVDAPIEAMIRELLAKLEANGAVVKKVKIPALRYSEYVELATSLSEASAIHYEQLKKDPNHYGEDIRMLFELGLLFDSVDYLQAQQLRSELKAEFTKVFEEIDVLIAPTLPSLPNDIGSDLVMINGKEEDVLNNTIRMTGPSNLTGLPALSMPIGLVDGLPVGMQIIGDAFDEKTIFNIAKNIEKLVQFEGVPPIIK